MTGAGQPPLARSGMQAYTQAVLSPLGCANPGSRYMTIARMIRDDLDALTQEFALAAHSLAPAAARLEAKDLEDSVRDLLLAMAVDLESDQSHQEQADKAQGQRPGNAPVLTEHAHAHAAHRLEQGFTVDQLLAEFRALRASLSRRLLAIQADLGDVIRLNEAIDQALLESIGWYGAHVELARKLFLGVFGHDLRTPLGAVMMSAEVILRDPALSPQSTVAAVRMKNAAQRMSRMIEDLIDFTRTRLGTRLPTRPERTDLFAIVQQTVEEQRAAHPTRDIILEPHAPLWGVWDGGRLGQLVSNLLGNAIQYGDPARPVKVGMCQQEAQAELHVHNEGAPIPEEARARIFEPLARFSRQETETLGHRASIGLGLYISREIVRAHGGVIEFESSQGRGTTFTVRLPVAPPQPQEPPAPAD